MVLPYTERRTRFSCRQVQHAPSVVFSTVSLTMAGEEGENGALRQHGVAQESVASRGS